MPITSSDRVQQVKPSATLAIASKAKALKAAGKDIISLSLGEPDFETPENIKEAAIKAIHDGFTKYTPVPGTPSLREAIVKKLAKENSLNYDSSQIIVSTGAKQSLYNLMQALLNEGDEVIIPTPYWVSYPDMVLLAGGTPITLPATLESDFKITPQQLEAAITDRTRLFMINSPSNPSGRIYSKAELAALGEVLKNHPNVAIVTDDIYEHIRWSDEPFVNILNAAPYLKDRTIIVNGVSKAYAMTGWRIGWSAGPETIMKAMSKIQSQSTSGACSIAQKAAEEAMVGDQSCIKQMVNAFKERHDAALLQLKTLKGFETTPTDGTFYLFPRVQEAIESLPGINDDVEFAAHLLENAGVAVVPGTPFGMPGYIRLSIALSIETFAEAVEKIKEIL